MGAGGGGLKACEMNIDPRSLDGQYCTWSQKISYFKNLLKIQNTYTAYTRKNFQFIVIIHLIVRVF